MLENVLTVNDQFMPKVPCACARIASIVGPRRGSTQIPFKVPPSHALSIPRIVYFYQLEYRVYKALTRIS